MCFLLYNHFMFFFYLLIETMRGNLNHHFVLIILKWYLTIIEFTNKKGKERLFVVCDTNSYATEEHLLFESSMYDPQRSHCT